MAKITTITVGLTGSVNLEPYVYIKPTISLTAEVGEKDSYDEVFKQLNVELKERMDAMVEDIEENRL